MVYRSLRLTSILEAGSDKPTYNLNAFLLKCSLGVVSLKIESYPGKYPLFTCNAARIPQCSVGHSHFWSDAIRPNRLQYQVFIMY